MRLINLIKFDQVIHRMIDKPPMNAILQMKLVLNQTTTQTANVTFDSGQWSAAPPRTLNQASPSIETRRLPLRYLF